MKYGNGDRFKWTHGRGMGKLAYIVEIIDGSFICLEGRRKGDIISFEWYGGPYDPNWTYIGNFSKSNEAKSVWDKIK